MKRSANFFEGLPERRIFNPSWEPTYYGAARNIADQMGRKEIVPYAPRTWKHGWDFSDTILHIRQVVGWGDENDVHLVQNRTQLAYARTNGYRHAHAVGAPFLYVSESRRPKSTGSLLVMPPHGLRDAVVESNEKQYVGEIKDIAGDFSSVTFCLHPHDVEQRKWTSIVEKNGFKWVLGATAEDENALKRMRAIFDTVEFMTTNSLGSHLPYAAFCGCKVSIYGSYHERKREDYKNSPFYLDNPDLLERAIDITTEQFARERFPELFRNPAKSVEMKKWAGIQLGLENKRSMSTMSRLMGWSFLGKIIYRSQKTTYAMSK
jgi:hypothetical protein